MTKWRRIESAPNDEGQILVGFMGQFKWFSYVAQARGAETGVGMPFARPSHWAPIGPPNANVTFGRSDILEMVAIAIQDADNRPCPEGYANLIANEDVSDWSVFLADAVLMALAEHGFNIVFDPLAAVSDMKTWPQDVRIENGLGG